MQSPHTGQPVHVPLTEMLKSVPEFFGLRLNEEPSYEVLSKDGNVEVRRYPMTSIASVTLAKGFDDFREEMLGKPFLAQYDAPFVLPFAKRNEVMVEVDTAH